MKLMCEKKLSDSPKLRNKGQKVLKGGRPAVNLRRQSTSATANRNKLASTSGTMVVVNKGNSGGVERDSDILRLQVSRV